MWVLCVISVITGLVFNNKDPGIEYRYQHQNKHLQTGEWVLPYQGSHTPPSSSLRLYIWTETELRYLHQDNRQINLPPRDGDRLTRESVAEVFHSPAASCWQLAEHSHSRVTQHVLPTLFAILLVKMWVSAVLLPGLIWISEETERAERGKLSWPNWSKLYV